jgi:phosphoheptose isomerase
MNWIELLAEHRSALLASESLYNKIKEISLELKKVLDTNGKVILCGNGGSFAHAQHFAAELVVRYRLTREPMRAIALGSNAAITTAICNDLDQKDLFVREFAALAEPKDCVFAFSTSGKSPNVLRVLQCARLLGVKTIGVSGANGMATPVDHEFRVPSTTTSVIQQIHTICIHALCEELEA